MKPNILFIVIDSLRADKCYGDKKTSVTPNIDSLIKNGTYFSQNITAAPATIPSISSTLAGLYPFECVAKEGNFFVVNPNIDNYVKNLKEYNYNCYATLPVLISYLGFDKVFFNNLESYHRTSTLYNGLGEKIIERFKSHAMSEPWFYYLHLYDLMWISTPARFNPDEGPNEIRDDKYGKNQYERIFSVMDTWLGRILHNLNLKNTLIVITADHGTDIGVYTSTMEKSNKHYQKLRERDSNISFKIGQKIAHKFPKSMKPVSKKLAGAYKSKSDETIQNKIKPELEKIEKMELRPYEKRLMKNAVLPTAHVYDDRVRVPLIFSGYNIPSDTIISQQVQSVDIFATIADIIGLDNVNHDRRGRSLIPLMQGKQLEEIPAFLESATNSTRSPDSNVIGIRTSEFKYFRDRDDSTKNIHLYDLREDPLEENNIAETKKDVVEKMEKMVVDILKGKDLRHVESNNEIGDEKSEIIESELKRLGYVS